MTLPATDPRATRPVAADVLLSDGTVAVLRPIVPEDRVALDELHAGVSDAACGCASSPPAARPGTTTSRTSSTRRAPTPWPRSSSPGTAGSSPSPPPRG